MRHLNGAKFGSALEQFRAKTAMVCVYSSLVSTAVRAIRVTGGGLEPSPIARIFPTSLTGDVTSEIAKDDWERDCVCSLFAFATETTIKELKNCSKTKTLPKH